MNVFAMITFLKFRLIIKVLQLTIFIYLIGNRDLIRDLIRIYRLSVKYKLKMGLKQQIKKFEILYSLKIIHT